MFFERKKKSMDVQLKETRSRCETAHLGYLLCNYICQNVFVLLCNWLETECPTIMYKFYDNYDNIHEKYIATRENDGAERDFEGVGRDMSIPFKLFLEMRTSTET